MQTSFSIALVRAIVAGVLFVLCCAGCGGGADLDPLENGVYLVLRRGTLRADVAPVEVNEAVAVHSYEFLDPSDRRPPEYVVVDTTERVPIVLSEPPLAVPADNGVPSLHLKFTPAAAARLREFTARHVGAPVAIVVGGRVVTLHKVRTAISGDGVVITRCADDACEFIRLELIGEEERP